MKNPDGQDTKYLGESKPTWDQTGYFTFWSQKSLQGEDIQQTNYFGESGATHLKWTRVKSQTSDPDLVIGWREGLKAFNAKESTFAIPECNGNGQEETFLWVSIL